MGCLNSKNCIRKAKAKETLGEGAVNSVHSSASSDSGDGDQLPELGVNDGDSDVGISRLSRVSSQFLPPEGSKTVRVPSGNYELRYSFLSQRGFYPEALDKPNQDSFFVHTPFGTNPDDLFFGVFDGHGEFGAQCSQFVKRRLCENLLRNSQFHTDAVEAIHAAFLTTNAQLHADALDDSMSGTTAITILVRGRMIYVANAGDSRAVIAERRGNDIVATDLSVDQTPFHSDELERVKHCGARVMTLDQIEGLKNPEVQCWVAEEEDDGDPPRLWVQNGMYPGTAFTRSIGDSVAESIGVVASPEIYTLKVTPNHKFIVIASDGVFEFLSSQTVVEMVDKFKDPRDACAAIVAESYRLWLQYETRTDDITIIVVHINGLTEVWEGDVCKELDSSSRTMPEVVDAVGSPSSLAVGLISRNHHVKHDLSRARLRAIESSLENGHTWVPSTSNRKTLEEKAHIECVLHDHFLFRKLTDSQCHVLLDCMQRVEVKPGIVIVEQGGEGDCFYVVGNGEFEVLATQEDGKEVFNKVLHRYTAENLSSFGELALMSNMPLQASVRAVTAGTIWALRREDFRGILASKFSNLASLKLLRSVELFSMLTILQLSHIAESLLEVKFSDGQKIVDKEEPLSTLYIIQKGIVRLSYLGDTLSPNVCRIFSTYLDLRTENQDINSHVVELREGSHFGEWALVGESIGGWSAVSIGNVVCLLIAKEKLESVVGPLSNHSQEDQKIYATDCSEIGLVRLRGTDAIQTLKRFIKRKIKELGKEAQVMKEKDMLFLLFCATQSYVGIL
ncbi:Protein phosphatase 2C and cyclic nucleotide-binding/kinase domain-containing protein [Apostasia shenzhenica]|uniref:protein-serine/threonine phosphatase n=1 Tax=Apostasia shenzhenica TaxID=1088818 RepID=A0A2I0AFV4_9ASPA|nr:Protein phosphatase 2C and cyclic nucleotide-binding/kinase domain-containing protein [Apostasia shenzhenica]